MQNRVFCSGFFQLIADHGGTGFPGGTYQQIFYVADVEVSGPAINVDLGVDLDEADFLVVFPLKGEGRARLIERNCLLAASGVDGKAAR